MFIFKAAVVGVGTLGAGIAETIEAAGIPLVVKDLGGDYGGFGDVDFVIETAPEDLELKQELFAELDEVTPGRAILASGTSSLPITELADATIRPDKVVRVHFAPAAGSRVVEVVEGESTSPDTVQSAVAFVQRLRRTPIRCFDAPGLVVNRILLSGFSEVCRIQRETGVGYADLDAALTPESSGEGPFALADSIGLDVVLQLAEYLEDSFGDRFTVDPQLRELVARGDLGRKTGRGFHEHG